RRQDSRHAEARAHARHAIGRGADRAADRGGAVQRAPGVGRAAQEDPREESVAARRPGARNARMTEDLAALKRALRDRMRAARASAALNTDARVALTVSAVERLLSLPVFTQVEGRTIAGYVAVGGELSPAGALSYVG